MTSPDPPILPTLGQVIGAGKDRIGAVRPSAEPHLQDGEYSLLVLGLRGQFSRARSRLAEEVVASQLGSASEAALSELAASNYDTPRPDGGTFALGEVTLTRTVVHSGPTPDVIIDPETPPEITDPDASGETSILVLFDRFNQHFFSALQSHVASVFDPVTGIGAHEIADTTGPFVPSGNFMGDLVADANTFKAAANRHFGNHTVVGGAAIAAHKDVDTVNVITAPDATVADPAGFFDLPNGSHPAATLAERQKLLILVNAIKRALNAHMDMESRPGVVRTGTLFDLVAVPTASPPVAAVQYRATRDVYVRAGAQETDIPIQATRTGAAANLPAWATSAPVLTITARGTLFDAGLAPTALRAAGGGPGMPDPTLVAAARASWTGSHGPTPAALRAGSLLASGAVKMVLREDPLTGIAYVYPIDASWAQSARWTSAIEQVLRGTGHDDEWLGLGCKESIGAVTNRLVRAEVIVQLRDPRFLADTETITAKIADALRAYFDERRDFWVFRLATIRAVVSGVDRRRVLTCSFAAVRDSAGLPIAEPAEPAPGEVLTHWWLEQGAVIVDYIAPS
jgi:hypothetical protein